MSKDENKKNTEEGTPLMSKGEPRKAPIEVTESYMNCVIGAIMQRNFAHNIGLNIISIVT